MRTGWISRLVDNPLGHFIQNHARTSGMDLSEVVWVPYDGSGRSDRIGLNFTEVGIGVRAPVNGCGAAPGEFQQAVVEDAKLK